MPLFDKMYCLLNVWPVRILTCSDTYFFLFKFFLTLSISDFQNAYIKLKTIYLLLNGKTDGTGKMSLRK